MVSVDAAVALCVRHLGSNHLWFALLDVFLAPRRVLSERAHRSRCIQVLFAVRLLCTGNATSLVCVCRLPKGF